MLGDLVVIQPLRKKNHINGKNKGGMIVERERREEFGKPKGEFYSSRCHKSGFA